MDLKIFGLSCRLEVIIICLVVGFILGAHLLCSCSKIGLTRRYGYDGFIS